MSNKPFHHTVSGTGVQVPNVLAIFDEAVRRYFEHTTAEFRGFHEPHLARLRLKLKQVLEGDSGSVS